MTSARNNASLKAILRQRDWADSDVLAAYVGSLSKNTAADELHKYIVDADLKGAVGR